MESSPPSSTTDPGTIGLRKSRSIRDRARYTSHKRITGSGGSRTIDSFVTRGSGERGCKGDGGPPNEAQFDYIADTAVGPDGSLYVADLYNRRIRKIDSAGSTITTVVGNGRAWRGRIPNGTSALRTGMRNPQSLAFDPRTLLHLIDDTGAIYRLEPNGTLTLFSDVRDLPSGTARGRMVFDSAGNLIIADYERNRILEVSADGSRVRTIVSGSNASEAPSISSVISAASPEPFAGWNHPPPIAIGSLGGRRLARANGPFVVRVELHAIGGGLQRTCTGSLVAPNWVLTVGALLGRR